MTDEIRELGGEVRARAPVERLDRRGRHASREVVAGGERYEPGGTSSRRCRCARRSSISEPAAPAEVLEAAARPALPRLPHRRARRSTARTSSRTTGSTSTTRTCASAASRTTAPGARGWSRTRQGLRRARVLLLRRRRPLDDGATTTLVELATTELEQLGLAPRSKVERGYAVRVPKAYPMYDADYAERVASRSAGGSTGSRTSSRSAATASTATTTRTTRC